MDKPKPQPFEAYPILTSHIAAMANGMSGVSLIQWDAFLGEINLVISDLTAQIDSLTKQNEVLAIFHEDDTKEIERMKGEVVTEAELMQTIDTAWDVAGRFIPAAIAEAICAKFAGKRVQS